ncbi:MAG: hypothetical protein ACR2P0_19470 [Acidimicrobiales bacterium]
MAATPTPAARIAKAVAPLLIALGLVIVLAAQASAQVAQPGECGTHSFGFTGTRLINDGISNAAGPFAIELPAGRYDVVMKSHDNHPTADYQPDQTEEQWYFVLDSGYTSPFTVDVPSDAETSVTHVTGVEIEAATTITVRHRAFGSVNSVNVVCVGFTPAEVIAGPATTVAAVAPDDSTTSIPPASVAPTVAPTTATPATATTTTVATAVASQVERPAQLAVTGPTGTHGLLLLGLALIASGLAATIASGPTSRLRNTR